MHYFSGKGCFEFLESMHYCIGILRLQKLVKMSYDMYAEGNESDAIFLEKAIDQEMNEELREALQDLDDFLFGY